ncbi:DNA recombination protein RmuC [Nocardia gamkensis]|uniref:DNA recombination protein RmuC n=1 Tax=Nocardia gamkensis TaxID=352869 RepID=UPI0036EA8701
MNGSNIVAFAVGGMLFVVLGYLLARARSAARLNEQTSARRVAEEQSREARRQVDELRVERDAAVERADKHANLNADLNAGRRGLDEQLGKLTAELDAVRSELHRKEAVAQQLRADLGSGNTERAEVQRKLRDTELQVVALRAGEARLIDQVHALENQIAELTAQNQALQERAAALEAVRKQIDQTNEENLRLQREAIETLGKKLLAQSEQTVITAAETKLAEISKPVRDGLAQMDKQLKEFEIKRTSTDATLRQEIKGLAEESVRNREQTRSLVQALKRPQTRGRWGEVQLKRVVELAGMVEHCDFAEQVHIPGGEEADRPDLVVKLPEGKHAVVDSKVSLEAFIAATEANDETQAGKLWIEHARQLRKHVDALAGKEYFRKVAGSPEFVIMFVPGEPILQAAFEHDPSLLEYAASKLVLITSPMALIAMLRAVAFGWKQEALRENLSQVLAIGTEIYDRLAVMGGHVERLGGALDRTMKMYNDTVGSLEGRVMVTARKFKDLKLTEKDLPQLEPRDRRARPLSSVELIESAAADRAVHAVPERGDKETA